MSWTKQFLLACVLILVSLGAYWLEFSHRPKAEQKKEDEARLIVLRDKKISTLQIRPEGMKQSFELSCVTEGGCTESALGAWKIVMRSKVPDDVSVKSERDERLDKEMVADVAAIRTLLQQLAGPNLAYTVDLSKETNAVRQAILKEYALDGEALASAKQFVIELDATQSVYAIGNKHDIKDEKRGEVFAILNVAEPQKIYLVAKSLVDAVSSDFIHWRDKTVFGTGGAATTHAIQSFKVTNDQRKAWVLTRDSKALLDVSWSVQEEGSTTKMADRSKVQQFLDLWNQQRVIDFIFEDKNTSVAKVFLTKLTLKIALQWKATPEAVELQEAKIYTDHHNLAYMVMSHRPEIVQIEGSAVGRFENLISQFAQKQLLPQGLKSLVAAITITSSDALAGYDAPLKLELQKGQWFFDKQDISSNVKSKILDKLFFDAPVKTVTAVLPKSFLSITLSDAQNVEIAQLKFWKTTVPAPGKKVKSSGDAAQEKFYIMRTVQNSVQVLELPEVFLSSLPWKKEALFEKPEVAANTEDDGNLSLDDGDDELQPHN